MSKYSISRSITGKALTLCLSALLIAVFYNAAGACGTVDTNFKGITSSPGTLGAVMQSTAGFTGMQYGLSTDRPIPNAFLP